MATGGWRTEKCILNSDCMIILPIVRVKNMVENVDWIFLKMADQSFLVKLVLIMHNKCSQAHIAHNSVNRPMPSNVLKQISEFKRTDG